MVLLRRINQRKKPLVLVSRAFSSSSNPPFPPPPPPTSDPDAARSPSPPPPNPGAGPNPSSSLFRDIRERLKSAPTPPQTRRISMNPPRPNVSGAQTPLESLNNVRKMLQNFREPQAGGGAPSVPASNSGATPSFQDLLKTNPALRPDTPGNFDAIRNSLRNTLRITPQKRPTPGTLQSPSLRSAFDREKGQKLGRVEGPGKDKDSDNELTRSYSYEELGKRLGELRPADVAKDGKDWFSLEELQGRIAKLAVLEKEEDQRSSGNIQMTEIRESIKGIKQAMHAPMPIFVGNIGTNIGLQDYLQAPPQEELLERYFHPDHMSSEEKMKLELQKVRDEFKMSEDDCGSARVQIAQLTVKIKHLSSVLHKKDKHSRKGLQDMVQRRKKYLKYLRRTDWDSYCLVLSKLGLRDVPEYKAPDYKSKSTSKVKSKKSKSKSKRKVKA